jgi:hypothetical protein
MKLWIAIDNGTSGSIAVLDPEGNLVYHSVVPTKECLNYTKEKAWITRIDFSGMRDILYPFTVGHNLSCYVERPAINPHMFRTSICASRSLESTEILLELLKIPYQFVDSREWQREMLPKGLLNKVAETKKIKNEKERKKVRKERKKELKLASDQIVKRLFPEVILKTTGDGDSILIAEYARRKYK